MLFCVPGLSTPLVVSSDTGLEGIRGTRVSGVRGFSRCVVYAVVLPCTTSEDSFLAKVSTSKVQGYAYEGIYWVDTLVCPFCC